MCVTNPKQHCFYKVDVLFSHVTVHRWKPWLCSLWGVTLVPMIHGGFPPCSHAKAKLRRVREGDTPSL